MLEVENLSPFTRAFHDIHTGKEYIFRAKQVRSDIPDTFLNSNGTLRFAGLLKLRRIINNETGDSTRAYIPKTPRDESFTNPAQEWEYIFINEAGQKFITKQVTKFCEEHDLNPTSIRNYIKKGKTYKGWNISRRPLTPDDNPDKINTTKVMLYDRPE
jgi:hypothetical protein